MRDRRSGIRQIVEIQLRRLQAQLAEANLKFRITEKAQRQLAEEGFDPAYGARPLKRVIQQRLANPLATAMLEGRINAGDTVAIVEVMKLMNHVSAPVAGVVTSILAENGATVEYGQALVTIDPEG